MSAIIGNSLLFRSVRFFRGRPPRRSRWRAGLATLAACKNRPCPMSARKPVLSESASRGFVPAADPVFAFPGHSELAELDAIGRDLPSLLEDPGFRTYVRGLSIPPWPTADLTDELLPLLRLSYVRLGFLASGYV